MTPLNTVITALLGREGAYSNNPKDSGGETMWGITEQVARANGYSGPMSSMPRAAAANIYKEQYWFGPQFDQVAVLNPGIAEELLDTGVNMGTGVAVKFLQRALNVLNRGASIYPDIIVDGRIGKMTLFALETYLANRSSEVLMRLLNSQQGVRYMELSEQAPKNEEFTFGWIANRVS